MSFEASYIGIDECDSLDGGIAVVVDVVRAFTTAAWALHLGAERIVLVATPEEALSLKSRLAGSLALKDGRPAPGFDLSNSPVELQAGHDLRGRTIVQCTTHGTVGAVAARRAEALYCAGFVCASATAAAIRSHGLDSACFVVTGENGKADEDRACAEYIAALLRDGDADPAAYLRRVAASTAAERHRQRIADGEPGYHARDIALTMEADRFDFALQAREEDGLLCLRKAYT